MGLVNVLGSFLFNTTYDDLPQKAISGAKERILDYIGAVFYAYGKGYQEPMLSVLRSYNGNEESTVIGEGVKLPCSFAALVNSVYNNQISDGSRFSGQHPSCVIIPATLASAEAKSIERPVSGKELILAVALGYEVMIRIGKAMHPSHYMRGFTSTCSTGPIGAAAAVSKVLNLSAQQVTEALAIATTMGQGLHAATKAPHPLYSFQVGRASEAGVLCAIMAQHNLKGSGEILEEGFFPAFSDKYDVHLVEEGLGQDYQLPKTYIKLYGGIRAMHAPIDAAVHVVKKHNIELNDIEKIHLKTVAFTLSVQIPNPQNARQAEYSIEFGIACALVCGDVFPDRFTEAMIGDKGVREIMKRVTVEHDPDLDLEFPQKRPSVVEITTKRGEVFSFRIEHARGEHENPLSRAELVNKFHRLAGSVVDEGGRQRLIDYLACLETQANLNDLFPMLKA